MSNERARAVQVLASVVTIDVAVPTNRRDRETLRFHRLTLAPDETTRRDDLRVTTVERTLFDIAATGADIRRLAHEAIAKKLTSHAKLKAFAARHRGERGAPAIRRVAGEPHTRGRKERSARTTPISSGRNSGWSSNSTRRATRPSSPSRRTAPATVTTRASD